MILVKMVKTRDFLKIINLYCFEKISVKKLVAKGSTFQYFYGKIVHQNTMLFISLFILFHAYFGSQPY